MKKTKHGGKRPGAGAPKVKDKKVTLTIYPRQSQIDAAGGKDAARAKALAAIK